MNDFNRLTLNRFSNILANNWIFNINRKFNFRANDWLGFRRRTRRWRSATFIFSKTFRSCVTQSWKSCIWWIKISYFWIIFIVIWLIWLIVNTPILRLILREILTWLTKLIYFSLYISFNPCILSRFSFYFFAKRIWVLLISNITHITGAIWLA